MDKDALVDFAIEAVTELQYQSNQLFQQPKSDVFFLTLKTHLTHVQGRLEKRASCHIKRVIALLEALERLAKVSLTMRASISVLSRY
jgi:hypothetical protein